MSVNVFVHDVCLTHGSVYFMKALQAFGSDALELVSSEHWKKAVSCFYFQVMKMVYQYLGVFSNAILL